MTHTDELLVTVRDGVNSLCRQIMDQQEMPDDSWIPVRNAVDAALDSIAAELSEMRYELGGGRHEGDKGLRREYAFAIEVAGYHRSDAVRLRTRLDELERHVKQAIEWLEEEEPTYLVTEAIGSLHHALKGSK
jgi:hypothetical protein